MSAASFKDPMKSTYVDVGEEIVDCVSVSQRSGRRSFLGALTALMATSIFLLTLGGCGGGTRGTGDQLKSVVVGTVVDTSGAPLSSATITQLETGDSTVTDNSGTFALEVAVEGGSARLLIEREGFEGTATLSGLGEGTQADPVEFTITVDLVSGIVAEVTVNDSGPTPTPQPTAGPNPQPSPTPSDVTTEREHLIKGSALNQSGTPVAGVRLTVAGNGSVLSDSNGRFTLTVRTSSSRVRVTVRFGENRGSFILNGLPTGRDAQIDVTVRLVVSSAPQYIGGEIADPDFNVTLSDIRIR